MAHRALADRRPHVLLSSLLALALAASCDASGSKKPSSSGPAVATGDQASIKICNTLSSDVELSVGSVKLTAKPNQCMPAVGQSCAGIPSGTQEVKLSMGGAVVWSQRSMIQAGAHYTTKAALDGGGKPTLEATTVTGAQACTSYNPTGSSAPPGNTGNPPGNQPPPPAAGGTAVAKLCHQISAGTEANPMSVEFELVVGNVRMKASTGGCSVAVGQACSSLPSGSVQAELFEGGMSLGTSTLSIEGGKEYLFELRLDAMNRLVLGGGALKPEFKCSAVNPYEDTGPAPPPANPMGPTVAKFCNLNLAGDVELTVGSTSFKAASGQCSAPTGTMCTTVTAGADQRVALKVAGKEVKVVSYDIPGGTEIVFLAGTNPATMMPDIQAGTPKPPATCAGFVPQ